MTSPASRRAGACSTVCLFVLALIASTAVPAHAQKLGIQGDRFTVDGTPKFLTFITYFGAMGAPNVTADLHLIKSLGFDGIRIWPNLDTGPQLMNGDGSLRAGELSRLTTILNIARQERLVVDVTFTYEHIAGMTPATALTGITHATVAMRAYDNLLFDIQNERNVFDNRYMSERDVRAIYLAIKAADPARIVTASDAPVEDAQEAANFTARNGLDVTAYHEPRPSDWYTAATAFSVVGTLRAIGKPVYLQEPNVTHDTKYYYPSNDRAEYFLQALAHAKLAGAAAWCFHTEEGVDFRFGPPFFEDRLRSHPDVEWAVVSALNARIVLRTSSGRHFLVAESGGGGGVRADRSSAGPGSWDVFGVVNLGGGPMLSGDRVALATADGGHYMHAVNGGGGAVRATSTSVAAFETFTIEKNGGGVIHHGDAVTLRPSSGSWYLAADAGGGAGVVASSATRGASETFTVLFVTPHITDGFVPTPARTEKRQ